jgi:hypothetical protein
MNLEKPKHKNNWARQEIVYPEWERQPKEPVKAFEMFKMYRDMGIFRSHMNVAKQMYPPERLYQGRKNVGNMSMKWRWSERISAYHRHLDRIHLEETEKAVRDMASRHADYAKNTLFAAYFPVIELLKKIHAGDTNDIRNLPSVKLLELTYKSAQALVQVADLERKTRGEPTDIKKLGLDHTSGGEVIKPSINIQVKGSMSNLLTGVESIDD